MFKIFSRISDLEKRVEDLEKNNLELSDENKKLDNALKKTQDILSLVSYGAHAIALDVAQLVEIINPGNNKNSEKLTTSWLAENDDEVLN